MVGIVSYGAYIPKWRVALDLIAKGTPGERSVAGPDEDSVTMAVGAVLDCLQNADRSQVDGLFFASTTSPFAEKQMAALIAKAADLREDIITADFAGSLKSGTTALRLATDAVKAGSARQLVVVAADSRQGAPGSEIERGSGDGAGAVLIGRDQVAASLEASASVANEIFDVWRRTKDIYITTWESRFDLTYGYAKSMGESITALMKKANLTPKDFTKVVFYCPDGRTSASLAKDLGFDPKSQLQPNFFGALGNTGSAFSLMLLAAALEEAKPGDNILLASYGSGSDAFAFKVNDFIEKVGKRRSVKTHLKSKRMVPDYLSCLKWRGLIPGKDPRLTYQTTYASGSAIFRERDRIFALRGSKCNACGSVQYPPQRVCAKCRTKDDFQSYPLYDKKGEIFTCSKDPVTGQSLGLINFEEGGRIYCNITDVDFSEIGIGTKIEMSFRKLDLLPNDTISSYFWKAAPLRDNI